MTNVAEPRTAPTLGHPAVMEDLDALTFRVHRTVYRSPDVFQYEMARIWAHTWLYLGHTTEVAEPGAFKTRTLGGRPLIFCRDSTGEIQVFLNSCPHRGTVLCREAEGNSRRFQCFYHAWTFNNDGSVAAIPDPDGYPPDSEVRQSMRLRSVPRMAIHEGFVFVAFDPDLPDLADHLGAAADYLSMAAEQSATGMRVLPGAQLYTVRGNWKLAVENAMDGYHFSPTHNTFVGYLRETGYQVTDDDQYAYDLGNGHCSLILTGHGGRLGMVWEPRFGEAEKGRTERKRQELVDRLGEQRARQIADASRILYVFPNLLLFDLEGLSIRQLEPTAAGLTDVRAWQFVPSDEPPETREIRLRVMVSFVGPGGLATPDDIEAYEAVQRGVEATAGDPRPGYDVSDMSRGMADERAGRPGRSIDEGAMRAFWRHWARVMGG